MEEADIVSAREGMAALRRAIAGDHITAARMLVLDGADVNLVDSEGAQCLSPCY